MKAESLVIADQHAAVNTFPGLVHTARHTMSQLLQVTSPRGAQGVVGNWVKS